MSTAEGTALGIVLIVAGALRFTALGAGIPAAVGVDEPFIMDRAFAMMVTGEFNPGFFEYPSLYMYLQTAVASVRFVVGSLSGEWYRLDQVTSYDFYLWGRALTAALGTLTVLVTWRVGRRLGPVAGLLAAAWLAVEPQHVLQSHFVLTDIPMTFFVATTLLASIRAREAGVVRAFALAGALSGLAAATKYTGGVALVIPLVALGWTPMSAAARLLAAGAIVGSALLAFLLAAPYTVLSLPAFLEGFGYLAHVHASGEAPGTPAWWTYWLHLQINLGRPLLWLSGAAMVVGVVQAFRGPAGTRVVWASAVGFIAVFYTELSRETQVYGRYLLPILPALFVLAGGGLALALARWGPAVRRVRWRGMLAGVVVAGLLFGPAAIRTGGILVTRAKTSTNELAFAWILELVPDGASLVVEAEGMRLPPRYRARNVLRLIERSYEDYVQEGVEYLVASSLASRGALAGGPEGDGPAYRRLFQRTQMVYAIQPSAEHPGSEIRVYRIRDGR